MEKEHQPESMATITMKTEYPPSEVYSTSEPPPAYRQRESSAVQIARIVGLTVVAASFILGAFILASSWVSARSSCHQLEQLDAMLDKELALEGRGYGNDGLMSDEPLPIGNAHALHAAPPSSSAAPAPSTNAPSTVVPQIKEDALHQAESKVDEDKLQKIDDDGIRQDSDENDSESSAEEEDELDAIRPMIKMPINLDLDELTGAILANNQNKGRMNCVVERRHEDPMERQFPFNILGALMPRAARSERIAIICHGGDEVRPMNGFPEPQSQVFAFPLSGPPRLPIRPQPDQRAGPPPALETRMPQFNPMMSNRNSPFPLPLPWDSSEEQMGGPGQAPREMRIQVQRVIALPSPHNMPPPPPQAMGPFPPPPQQPIPSREQNEQPSIIQFVPQNAPTQELEQPEVQKMHIDRGQVQMNLPWGLTPEDLHMIHRTAEDVAAAASQQRRDQQMDNDMQEVKTIVNTLAAAEVEEENRQAEEQQRQAEEQQRQAEEQQQRFAAQDMPAGSRMPRTLLLPQDLPTEERPHYVHPRSIRDAEDLLSR